MKTNKYSYFDTLLFSLISALLLGTCALFPFSTAPSGTEAFVYGPSLAPLLDSDGSAVFHNPAAASIKKRLGSSNQASLSGSLPFIAPQFQTSDINAAFFSFTYNLTIDLGGGAMANSKIGMGVQSTVGSYSSLDAAGLELGNFSAGTLVVSIPFSTLWNPSSKSNDIAGFSLGGALGLNIHLLDGQRFFSPTFDFGMIKIFEPNLKLGFPSFRFSLTLDDLTFGKPQNISSSKTYLTPSFSLLFGTAAYPYLTPSGSFALLLGNKIENTLEGELSYGVRGEIFSPPQSKNALRSFKIGLGMRHLYYQLLSPAVNLELGWEIKKKFSLSPSLGVGYSFTKRSPHTSFGVGVSW